MAVGYNGYVGGRFVGLYEDPLGPDTGVSGYLLDFSSMPNSAVFDAEDNLYVSDGNRSRVVYWNPFANPTRESTPTSTQRQTATSTPTATYDGKHADVDANAHPAPALVAAHLVGMSLTNEVVVHCQIAATAGAV